MVKCNMARHPLFLDDDIVATALDAATHAALERLAGLLPDLGTPEGEAFRTQLRAHLGAMLTGRAGHPEAPAPPLPCLVHGEDAFGDRFSLAALPLPRAGTGYAVQLLDTDTLLDRASGDFLPVRDPALAGLYESFDDAAKAARAWLKRRDTTIDQHPVAVVPAFYDNKLKRHVLIYGVLTRAP